MRVKASKQVATTDEPEIYAIGQKQKENRDDLLSHDDASARAKYIASVLNCIYSLLSASVRHRTNVVCKPTVREHEKLNDGFFILYILLVIFILIVFHAYWLFYHKNEGCGALKAPTNYFHENVLLFALYLFLRPLHFIVPRELTGGILHKITSFHYSIPCFAKNNLYLTDNNKFLIPPFWTQKA